MRDIKLRAKLVGTWNTKREGDWFYFTPEEMSHYLRRVPLDWSTQGQYTGLKDKNGKEIFEGDIVKEEQYMSNDLISEVRFYEGRFDSLVRVKEGYNCIDQYSPGSFEVIGNIHENPELLEVTKQTVRGEENEMVELENIATSESRFS